MQTNITSQIKATEDFNISATLSKYPATKQVWLFTFIMDTTTTVF